MKKCIIGLVGICFFISGGLGTVMAEEVAVGSVTPLTGKLAVYGEGFKNAMLLALDEVNEAGGINGKPMKIVGKCLLTMARELVVIVNVFRQ